MNEDDTNETYERRRRTETNGRKHQKFAFVDLTAPKLTAGKNLLEFKIFIVAYLAATLLKLTRTLNNFRLRF